MNFFSSRSNTFIFVFLFILAFIIRSAFVLYFNFDGLYGQDAYAYADWSKEFYLSFVNLKLPPHFYWPIGFFIFTSLMSLLTGGYSDTAALLVSLNAGALTAGVMYLLTKEALAGKKAPSVVSGLVFCFAGITVKSSIVIMADALGLLFIVISAYNLARYCNYERRANLVFCLIAFSFGLMTRYAAGLFSIVILAAMLFTFNRSANRRKVTIDFAVAAFAGAMIYLPQAYYVFKYGIPYFQYQGQHATWAASWNWLNFFLKDFMTFDGTQHYRLWNGLFYISPVFHPMFLSIFGLTFLYGLYKLLKNRKVFLLLFCVIWIAVYYFYLAGNPFQSIRYTMVFLPPLVLVSVFGLAELKLLQAYKSVFVIIGLLLLIGYGSYDMNKQLQRKNKELETVEWISENIPLNSMLFTFDITGAVNHYSNAGAREFFKYSYGDMVSTIDSSGNTAYIVIPLDKIKTQWKDLPLKKTYDSLQTNYKLVPIGSVNEFEGFRIEK